MLGELGTMRVDGEDALMAWYDARQGGFAPTAADYAAAETQRDSLPPAQRPDVYRPGANDVVIQEDGELIAYWHRPSGSVHVVDKDTLFQINSSVPQFQDQASAEV